MDDHRLTSAGQTAHEYVDRRLPDERETSLLADLVAGSPPVSVTGARDAPEAALANLLAALESLGLIADSTTATA